MAKDMNEDSEVPVGAGDGSTNDDSTNTPSLCTKKILDYLEKPLIDDRKSAAGVATVACLGYEENKSTVRLRLCRLGDASTVRAEYFALRNAVSSTMAAHADGVATNTKSYETKSEDLKKKLDEALQSFKKVKSQMAKVNTLACKLETACNDSCTAEERKIIDKGLGDKDRFKRDANELIKKVKGEKDENGQIVSRGVSHHADDLFDMGVKYAGIQASANIIGLKPMGETLLETANALADNVKEQIIALDGSLEEHQTELDTEIAALSVSQYERYTAEVAANSLETLYEELDEIAKDECVKPDYEDAITKLVGYCDEIVETFGKTPGCPPDTDNKYNTQDAPSC